MWTVLALLIDSGQLDAAEQIVTAGLALRPDDPDLLTALGQIHVDRDDSAAAMIAFDRAIEVDPGMVQARMARAALAFRFDDHERALADLGTVIERSPDDAETARFSRALVLQELGRWEEAQKDLTVVAEPLPYLDTPTAG